jgi:hypothetical protein
MMTGNSIGAPSGMEPTFNMPWNRPGPSVLAEPTVIVSMRQSPFEPIGKFCAERYRAI